MRPRRISAALSAIAWFALAIQPCAAETGRRALLAGINTYKWSGPVHKDPAQNFGNLAGAAGDAIWLKSILVTKYGFRDQDVLVITDASATREGILNAFRSHLISKSAAGDVALFYFAGHGSQRLTADGPAGSKVEDTIVPADARDPEGKVADIGASELHELFVALLKKTQNVTSILDTCHADTTVRGERLKRRIAPDTRASHRSAEPGERRRDALSAGNPVTAVVRISAARADQDAVEYTERAADGTNVKHGLMSCALFRELEGATSQSTWRDIMDRTRTSVAIENPLQEPQLEAPNPDTLLFGGAGATADESFFLVTPEHRKVLLNGGSLHALATGAGLDVFPPGTRDFASTPLSKVTVTDAGDFVSEAVVVSGAPAEQIPAGARAVIRSRPAAAFRFRICIEGDNHFVAAVRNAVLSQIHEAEQSSPDAADAIIRFADGSIYTESADGTMLSPAVPADDAAAERVVQQLRAWARWRQLLTTAGGVSAVGLEVIDESGTGISQVKDGAVISIRLCNRGSRAYFTKVVFFSSDGAVRPLDLTTDGIALSPGKCDTGGSFAITVDAPRTRSVDFFKAFATSEKVDFEPLASGKIRDSSQWSAVTKSVTVAKP